MKINWCKILGHKWKSVSVRYPMNKETVELKSQKCSRCGYGQKDVQKLIDGVIRKYSDDIVGFMNVFEDVSVVKYQIEIIGYRCPITGDMFRLDDDGKPYKLPRDSSLYNRVKSEGSIPFNIGHMF